jgi:hypothetical protein
MAQRTIKNYTSEDLILRDLGDIVVPANGAVDLGGAESRLLELASSENLLEALAQGIEKFQINDGLKDLSFSEGIELIRKIQRPTEVDDLGRWVVRSDSRKNGWDTVFQGAGDDMQIGKIGAGTPFRFDFEADSSDPRWLTTEQDPTIPAGFARQRVDWMFCDWIFIKEGTMYYYNIPKGSTVNMWIVAPPGGFFTRKRIDNQLNLTQTNYPSGDQEVKFLNWVINYPLEGTVPMGDELNTESASEKPAYPGILFRAEFTVPMTEGWEKAHGHWSLEIYRVAQDRTVIPEQYW